MIDIWKPLEKCVRLHHVDNGGRVGDLHNEQHAKIDIRLARLDSGQLTGDNLRENARSVAADAAGLKVTASMMGGDGLEHLRQVVDKVNTFLPDGQKLIVVSR